MPPSVQGIDQKLSVGQVASLKPSLSAQVTICSSNDSSSGVFLSPVSTASSCPEVVSRSRINSHCTPTSIDKVRERYLHRLGICAVPIEQRDSLHQRALSVSPTFTPSCSAPEEKTGHAVDNAKHDSLRQSSSQGDIPTSTTACEEVCSRHDKIILLRRSVQYTTKLKSDPDRENAISIAPISSISKFELSSAWTSLLSNDTASTASPSSEPLDGAFDLFSLPSDASVAFSRCDSPKSLDTTTIAPELLSSRDDLSVSSIPKQRKVSFDSTVKAVTIPSRRSYSTRIKSRIWSSAEEIYVNCIRNEREFEHDGKNWRTAKEESDFLCCASANELLLVHPFHFSGCTSSQSPWQNEQLDESHCDSASSSRPNEEEEEEGDVHDEPDGMFKMD
ncbi:hypothetical protein ACHAW5_007023 [Stephanodiscus triporus]|uniref:Uncharacterized protein n=1 Tax=Stephanodiscus triporus TaxID=2934178 RepID=A0ABD3QSU8_9STRA